MKIRKLDPRAKIPTRAHPTDAGLDLYAIEDTSVTSHSITKVRTGISLKVDSGYVGLIHPRSGLAAKEGVTVVNSPGTIDADYRGEVMVLLTLIGRAPGSVVKISEGDRIAQLVVQKVELPEIEVVEELSETSRGAGGFGSSGK